MEQENVFKKLRHLAAKVEKDSKHIETCINMPSHMRPGARSAELILKELQCNVQTMTLQAQNDLKELQGQVSFRNLLDNVQIVADLTKERLHLLDENLQKYGYKKAESIEANSNNQDSTDYVEDKENQGPDEEPMQQYPQTPKHSATCAALKFQMDTATRTPTLADFGISRQTLDFLAKQNMASQRKIKIKKVDLAGTPFKKSPALSSATQEELESPFDPNVVLTPGLFGYGRKIPTNTPEHMQGSAYLNSPIPPILQTPGLRQITKEDGDTMCLNAAASHNARAAQNCENSFYAPTPLQSRSMISIHPTPTSYHPTSIIQRNIVPQPKSMWQAEPTSDNTPTMPELKYQVPSHNSPDDPELISNALDINSGLPSSSSLHHDYGTPTEPQLMLATEPEKVPQKPVLLLQENSDPAKATLPAEPCLLSNQLATNHNTSSGFASAPTPFKAFRNFHDTEEMPKTPELTFSYSRYVDVAASLASSKDKSLSSAMPDVEGDESGLSLNCVPTTSPSTVDAESVDIEIVRNPSSKCQKSGLIALVSEEEFQQQSSFLQRLLPLNDVNAWVKILNKYIARKTEGQFLLESDISKIGIGPRAKTLLLLLVKLKRLSQGRPNDAGDQAYFVI
ncbi:uncharacterized protein LOC117118266 [Anneissia japonica]|uniref:uncharacterized protein LOC117118266 n=1 Tax=Anneissia japonica TaxID=1529436 RepID=UPI0014257823|nr:uncharacterized protein LOC117118266 [Anneissia japonica]